MRLRLYDQVMGRRSLKLQGDVDRLEVSSFITGGDVDPLRISMKVCSPSLYDMASSTSQLFMSTEETRKLIVLLEWAVKAAEELPDA